MQAVLSDRDEAIDRVIHSLPDSILHSLVLGIAQADGFAAGRLFDDTNSGCAVGVAIRVLFPAYRGRRARSLPFFRDYRSVTLREAHPEAAREFPHLASLESVFDRSVELGEEAHPEIPTPEVARAVAEHLKARCERLLELRATRARWQQSKMDDDIALGPSVVVAW